MGDFFSDMIRFLTKEGIESPRLEARLILAHVLKCLPSEIYSGQEISTSLQAKALQLLQRRLAHEPLDKILGHREFYKFDFITNNKVLSPRPDSEVLVEQALNLIAPHSKRNILDLGTGSGCLLASILAERPNCEGLGIDISAEALSVAKKNAENLNLSNRINLMQADWFAPDFTSTITQKFSLIVTNPPYIPTSDIANLSLEVKNYDPIVALDGGIDGFDSYKRIAEIASALLTDGGYILLEAGYGQDSEIINLFMQQNFVFIKVVADLAVSIAV